MIYLYIYIKTITNISIISTQGKSQGIFSRIGKDITYILYYEKIINIKKPNSLVGSWAGKVLSF